MRSHYLLFALLAACTTSMPDAPFSPDAGVTAPNDFPTTLADPAGLHAPAPVTAPPGAVPSAGWPLAIVLHGYGHDGSDALTQVGMPDLPTWAVVVTPSGLADSTGNRYWNANAECCDRDHRGNDDTAYIAALISEASAAFPIDPSHVDLVGQSNGGFMAEQAACHIPAVSATVDISGSSPQACPNTPITLLRAHGTNDTTVPYDGGTILPGMSFPCYPAEDTHATSGVQHGDFTGAYNFDLAIDGAESSVATAGTVTLVRMTKSHHQPRFAPTWEAYARAFLGE